MTLIINNLTDDSLSYVNGLVTVTANGSTTVTSEFLYPASRDPGLISDCVNFNVSLSDSITTYENQYAVQYLNSVADSLSAAVIGYTGTTVPSFAITVGGEGPDGNVSIGHFDSNDNLMTLDYATSATASTVPTYASFVAGKNPSGNLQGLSSDANGNLLTNLNDGNGNPLNSYNSQLDTNDIINTALSSGSISVGTTAIAARVGSVNLSNRKMLTISPQNGTVYLGASSSVTTSTGIPIFQNQVVSLAFSANVTPYLIAASTITVSVMEGS